MQGGMVVGCGVARGEGSSLEFSQVEWLCRLPGLRGWWLAGLFFFLKDFSSSVNTFELRILSTYWHLNIKFRRELVRHGLCFGVFVSVSSTAGEEQGRS